MAKRIEGWTGRTADIEPPPIAEVNALAAKLASEGRDLVNLGQAVLGLPPPRRAVERARAFLEGEEVHAYSPDPGIPEAREAVAWLLRERKAIEGARGDEVIMTCGANQAFVNAMLAVTRPGDEVVIFNPGYFDHEFAVKLAGCIPRIVRLAMSGGRFVIEAGEVESAIGPRTRCIVLVSPGNPSGMVATVDETAHLCRICARHGLWLVSDETYDLLVYPPFRHVSPASLGIHDRVVVIGSFSKTFALASWRVGYMWGRGRVIPEALKAQDAIVVCAPVPSQIAAVGAIAGVDEYVEAAIAALVERRDALLTSIRDWQAVDPIAPEGGTYVLARLVAGGDDVAACKDILVRTGVVLVPGSAFGGRGYVRISFGNQPPDRIREACARLARY